MQPVWQQIKLYGIRPVEWKQRKNKLEYWGLTEKKKMYLVKSEMNLAGRLQIFSLAFLCKNNDQLFSKANLSFSDSPSYKYYILNNIFFIHPSEFNLQLVNDDQG